MSHSIPNPPALKTCTKCSQSKPITEYYLFKSGKRAGWRNGYCRECTNASKQQWSAKKRGEHIPFADLPLEEWRPVPGYEGRYDVSNMGRVRSWQNPNGDLSVPRLKSAFAEPKDGYLQVALYKKHKGTRIGIARLVLMAFVGLPSKGMEASHLDGNILNNTLDNLAWETRLENEQHKVEHGTRPRGESQYLSKLTEEQVKEIKWLRHLGFKLSELSERFGIHKTGISKICRGESWKHVE